MGHADQDQAPQDLEIRVGMWYQKIHQFNITPLKNQYPIGVLVQGLVKIGPVLEDLMKGQRQEGCAGFQVGMNRGLDREIMILRYIGIKQGWVDREMILRFIGIKQGWVDQVWRSVMATNLLVVNQVLILDAFSFNVFNLLGLLEKFLRQSLNYILVHCREKNRFEKLYL